MLSYLLGFTSVICEMILKINLMLKSQKPFSKCRISVDIYKLLTDICIVFCA